MAIVFIEEQGGPLRSCTKQVTAEALGIAWADLNLSALTYPPECYTLVDGVAVEIAEKVKEVSYANQKAQREEELSELTYEFPDGRVIQVRPEDEPNFERAYKLFSLTGASTIQWVMADNKKYPVTEAELREAQEQGIVMGAAVWDKYPGV